MWLLLRDQGVTVESLTALEAHLKYLMVKPLHTQVTLLLMLKSAVTFEEYNHALKCKDVTGIACV